MTPTRQVRVGERGLITIPSEVRRAYDISPGDQMTLLDLGGVFVLSPRKSQIDALANQITRELIKGGETLESMLGALREERERYGESEQDHP
jgi:AbrB family looped-hinge helix DNA binding protein